jgi:hypothetical protein
MPADPAFVAVDDQRRSALVSAVATEQPDLSTHQRVAVAAALDILWSVASYERLVTEWAMDPDEAIDVIGWAIDAVAEKAEAKLRRTVKRRSTA